MASTPNATVTTHTYAASALTFAAADDAGNAAVERVCSAICDNSSPTCTLGAYDCVAAPRANASAVVWFSALTDGTPYLVSYYWRNAYGPGATQLAGDTFVNAFEFTFTQMTVPRFIAVTASDYTKTDASDTALDKICVSWTPNNAATSTGGSAITANSLLFDNDGTTLTAAIDASTHTVASDSEATSTSSLCVSQLETALVDEDDIGAACEATMFFTIARTNAMGSSWENEDAVSWGESTAGSQIILCKPSGTFTYSAAYVPADGTVTLTLSGEDDGGQAVVGHECTISGTTCLSGPLTGAAPTFTIASLEGSCWTGSNATVTLSC